MAALAKHGRDCAKFFRLATLKILREHNFKHLLTTLQYIYFEIYMRPWRKNYRGKK